MRLSCVFLLLAVLLGGCATQQQVEVLQPDEFRTMAIRLRTEMVRRTLLDEEGAYEPGLSMREPGEYRPDSFGEELFHRLSTRFRTPDNGTGTMPETFAQSLGPNDTVETSRYGFVLGQGMDIIILRMIAIADWNNDGIRDWLMVCRVNPILGSGPRDYYLVVERIPETGVLTPRTIAVYDCVDDTCTLFTGEARKEALGFDPEHPVIESAPGQQIIAPRNAPAPKSIGVKERHVKEESLTQ